MEYQFSDLTSKEEMYSQMFSIVACLGIVIIPLWSFVINRFGLFAYGICVICMEVVFYGLLITRWMPAIVFDFFLYAFIRVSIGAAISNYNRMFFDINMFGTFTGIVWFVNNFLFYFLFLLIFNIYLFIYFYSLILYYHNHKHLL